MKKKFSLRVVALSSALASVVCVNNLHAGKGTEAKSFFEITYKEIKDHGWLPVHGTISAIDFGKKIITVQGLHKPEVFQVTDDTRVWNRGRLATFSQAKTGDYIDAVVKLNHDQSITAIEFSLGKPADYLAVGIKNSPDKRWIKSPYATNQTAFDMRFVPHGTVVRCPYTGKYFIRP